MFYMFEFVNSYREVKETKVFVLNNDIYFLMNIIHI